MTEVMSIVSLFVPLLLVIWVANVAEARRRRDEPYSGLALVAYVFMAIYYGGAFFVGLMLHAVGFAVRADPELFRTAAGPIQVASWDLLAVGLWAPAAVGLLLLLPRVRRVVAQFTALDPESPVHVVALTFTMLVAINLLFTLGFGLDNLANLMAIAQAESEETSNTMLTIWAQQILTALLAMVGVGWLTRRDWRATLVRLGVTPMSGRQWLVGIGVGVGLVPLVVILEWLMSLIGWGAQADVSRLTEMLLGGLLTSPWGILTLGLAAALGEETIFRGAMQPRFGLLLTALLFALVHSNYGITFSTLVVFMLGLLLGWLRLRFNTSTAMVTHAVYNMSLGLIAFFGLQFFE